jgi:hypothetical protein
MTVYFLPETRKQMSYVQDNLNKISVSEADEVKEKCRLCYYESNGFEIMCQISCVFMGEDLLGSEGLEEFEC